MARVPSIKAASPFTRALIGLIMLAVSTTTALGRQVNLSVVAGTAVPGGVAPLTLSLGAAGTRPDTLVVKLRLQDVRPTIAQVTPGNLAGKLMEYRAAPDGLTIVFFGGPEPLLPGDLATVYVTLPVDFPGDAAFTLVDDGSTAATQEAESLSVAYSGLTIPVGTLPVRHSADTSANGRIELAELLRAIQLYNLGEFGCDSGAADGYAPGAVDRGCAPHDLDYAPADWRIGLSELLRLIQFFNAPYGAYHGKVEEEDGFAPGPSD